MRQVAVALESTCVIIAGMDAYFERRAREIFESIRYATIATSDSQGNPWNSPVYSTKDGQANIYWTSDKQNQHSQNVRQNSNVFIVFYDSTVPPGKGEGVYLKATALELSDMDEIRSARQLIGGADATSSEQFWGDGIRRIYKAVPTDAWMNTTEVRDGVFIRDYRVEVPLAALRSALRDSIKPYVTASKMPSRRLPARLPTAPEGRVQAWPAL